MKIMNVLVICFAAFLMPICAVCQDVTSSTPADDSSFAPAVSYQPGTLNVIASDLLNSILENKYVYDSYNSGYEGYRVQIFSAAGSNSKTAAYTAAEEFEALKYDVPVYITFKAPYYRVRVGNFRDKIDADHLQKLVSRKYKASFAVKEFISAFDSPYLSPAALEKIRINDSIAAARDSINMLLQNANYQDDIVPESSSVDPNSQPLEVY